jgi:signal transduction histidine kinase/Na+/proline symporter
MRAMSVDLSTLLAIGLAYLTLLFAIAWLTDRNVVPSALASHPLVYTLSLGTFACGWSFFGMTGVASHFGIAHLGFFIGTGAVFLFAPLLMLPLLRICRRMQFTSLPDLLAYRYRSARVGAAATAGMLLAALPLVAVQIRIVSEIAARLSDSSPTDATLSRLGLVFAAGIAVFAMLFGARTISERERHSGLVVTMAFETLVKLCAVLVIGAAALGAMGGADGLEDWLSARPGLLESYHAPLSAGSGHILTLAFLSAATGMPHLFHMALYENPSTRAVMRASWGFPLLLLLLSLPVLPVLWAGMRFGLTGGAEYFGAALGITLASPVVALAAFVAAVSAASSTVIVISLALATMTMNNFVLPFYRLGGGRDIYRGLLAIRVVLIALVIIAAWAFTAAVTRRIPIETLGFAAFIAAAQFFPGTLAIFYWPAASRAGFLAGLLAGFGVWALAVLESVAGAPATLLAGLLSAEGARSLWTGAAVNSLALNTAMLVLVSWIGRQSAEEREAAAVCSLDNLSGRSHRLQAQTPGQFTAGLASALGRAGAEREVARALHDLGYDDSERRPYAMRRLRDRVEANLSRLMGASVAMELVDTHLPYAGTVADGAGEDIHLVESRLEGVQHQLTGFAAELDALRRLYRDTLQELPLGVCGINPSSEIVMWNRAIERTTGIRASAVIGSTLDSLPPPWGPLIAAFVTSGEVRAHQREISAGEQTVWISLYQASNGAPPVGGPEAHFVLVEDVTENQLLQQELFHSERLASIGRLAAGVAHEIGNPVTGIDCLAQNLLAETQEDGVRESVRQILRQTLRIGNILNTLVNFAHSGPARSSAPERLSIAQCVDEAIYLLGLDRGARAVDFRNLCPPEACVHADGQKLLQVFVNLLSNARDASSPGAEVRVESRLEGDSVVTRVIDVGSGIPTEHLGKVFDPFFTTKAPGEGTGLGLALVYAIVRDMQGEVGVESPWPPETRRGTCVTVRLPAAA